MKKVLFGLLVILFLPTIAVKAENIEVTDAYMSVEIPDEWYIITRNRFDIGELDLTEEEILDFFQEYNLFLNAFNDQYDVYIYMNKVENIGNLSDYYDFEIEDFANELLDIYGADSYEIYDKNYKFIKMEYIDSEYYIMDYYTIINDYGYIISVQQLEDFSDADRLVAQKIVDSVVFDNYQKNDNKEVIIVVGGIPLVIILALVGLIISRVKEKK